MAVMSRWIMRVIWASVTTICVQTCLLRVTCVQTEVRIGLLDDKRHSLSSNDWCSIKVQVVGKQRRLGIGIIIDKSGTDPAYLEPGSQCRISD